MSFAGVLRLFRVKPHNPVGPGGQMALADHLRELRARTLVVAVVLVVGIVVAWFFYEPLFAVLQAPYDAARERLAAQGVKTEPVLSGVGSSLLLRLKICSLANIVITSPLWLYQIWAFIVPGLHAHERRSTKLFAVIAGPLFVAGVAVAYYVLPKGMEVLIGFTPGGIQSLIDFSDYLRFIMRMMLVFGVAFEIPLFVVMLNLAGVVTGKQLGRYRPWILIFTFVFAAVATPSTDPFSMLFLAVPMLVLFGIAEIIARLADRARGRGEYSTEKWDDDEASVL